MFGHDEEEDICFSMSYISFSSSSWRNFKSSSDAALLLPSKDKIYFSEDSSLLSVLSEVDVFSEVIHRVFEGGVLSPIRGIRSVLTLSTV